MTAGGLWAVLPVKAWSEAKRRLSPVLSAAEREDLARSMLGDVLAAVAAAPDVTGTLAVTADREAANYLEDAGCEVLAEPRRGLNRALDTAADELRGRSASTMLVLPIDLPLIGAERLGELCAHHLKRLPAAASRAPASDSRTAVTVVPDRFRSGTNALLCSPPGCIPFRFGDGSFRAHLHEAERRAIRPVSLEPEGFGLDVDHPDDLAEFLRLDRDSRTSRFLLRLGIQDRLGD